MGWGWDWGHYGLWDIGLELWVIMGCGSLWVGGHHGMGVIMGGGSLWDVGYYYGLWVIMGCGSLWVVGHYGLWDIGLGLWVIMGCGSHEALWGSPPDYVVQHWRDDAFFGAQYLNGVNPVLLRRCSRLPHNFAVTPQMVAASLGPHTTLQREMEVGDPKGMGDLGGRGHRGAQWGPVEFPLGSR